VQCPGPELAARERLQQAHHRPLDRA
jgi:hypothetical protein